MQAPLNLDLSDSFPWVLKCRPGWEQIIWSTEIAWTGRRLSCFKTSGWSGTLPFERLGGERTCCFAWRQALHLGNSREEELAAWWRCLADSETASTPDPNRNFMQSKPTWPRQQCKRSRHIWASLSFVGITCRSAKGSKNRARIRDLSRLRIRSGWWNRLYIYDHNNVAK